MMPGSVCRHLKIAGRVIISRLFHVTSQQPRKLQRILSEQLAGWFTDEKTWPADRSFDVFCRWFDYQHHSVLIDLCDEPLTDESD
jgi:hypothetical protein